VSNQKIRAELGRTTQNVGQYMREMNNLIDCHELSAVANMEVDSDEEQNNRRLGTQHPPGVFDAQERKHAGTGGSSKMRARPNNASGT